MGTSAPRAKIRSCRSAGSRPRWHERTSVLPFDNESLGSRTELKRAMDGPSAHASHLRRHHGHRVGYLPHRLPPDYGGPARLVTRRVDIADHIPGRLPLPQLERLQPRGEVRQGAPSGSGIGVSLGPAQRGCATTGSSCDPRGWTTCVLPPPRTASSRPSVPIRERPAEHVADPQ